MKYVLFGFVSLFVFSLFGNNFAQAVKPEDRLKKAYYQSHNVVSEPYSSTIEADDVFQESNAVTIWGKDWISVWLNDNVIVRFSRFLMRMAIVIAVGMLIFTGIKIGLALGDSGKLNAALKDAWIVLLGVFLVLASVAIVYLVSSLTRWTLKYDLFN